MRLTDKRAVVTGAAHGIGEATARIFAGEGARVVLVDVDADAGRQAAESIRETGGTADFLEADITDPQAVVHLVQEANRLLGGIDIWMNNAGGGRGDDALDVEPHRWQADLDLNLTSHFLCCRSVVPVMVSGGGGSIINVSSVNALWGIGAFGYSAAKAGLISFTKNVAVAHGPQGVRANVICPGTIDTETVGGYWERKLGGKEKLLDWYPVRRLGRPEDIAYLAVYLGSDESTFVNGATLVIDGGLTAGTQLFGAS